MESSSLSNFLIIRTGVVSHQIEKGWKREEGIVTWAAWITIEGKKEYEGLGKEASIHNK